MIEIKRTCDYCDVELRAAGISIQVTSVGDAPIEADLYIAEQIMATGQRGPAGSLATQAIRFGQLSFECDSCEGEECLSRAQEALLSVAERRNQLWRRYHALRGGPVLVDVSRQDPEESSWGST